VLPYFRKSEDNENGASDLHGTGGPLKIANLRVRHPLSDAFLQAWAGAGLPLTEDINAVPQRGMGYLQTNQWRGQRWSASRAFLWEAMKRRRNLAVKTKAQVTRILFDGLRATGVEYVRDAVIHRTSARRGVIVSAGVFNSPQILMLSGIGDEQHLRRHGISPLVDLKGVGRNLQDHPGVTHTVATSMSTYNVENTLFHKAWYGAQWLFFGRGPGTTPDCHLIGFAATGPDRNRANIQYHFGPVGYEFGDAGAVLYEEPAATAFTNLSRPRSRGWVGLRSNDPMDHPAIQPNLLDDERDIGELVDGAKLIRSVFEQPQFSRYVKRELTPGAGVRSDDEWRAYVIEQAAGIFHPAGTCKMGRDEMAVVDSRLRVRGLENLFVADASIMPTVTSANLSANCIMIGEKFADMLKRGQ
jgi:choline dehydrogenase